MDVVAHLLDDCLHGCRLADHFHLLRAEVFDPTLELIDLIVVLLLLAARVEADEHLEHLVVAEAGRLFRHLFLQFLDMLVHFSIIFLHGLVVAEYGFADLLLEVSEESLDNGEHLVLGLQDALFDALLLFDSEGLLVLDLLAAVAELLNRLLEEGVNVPNDLVDAEWWIGYF